MTVATGNRGNCRTRTYRRSESAVFLKTKEKHGGLSNMAGGFPLVVNGVAIRSSEALYQACRFPHLPEVQRIIIAQRSPMSAKMKGKPYRDNSRPDWDSVRIKIMRWCLQGKLAQNWDAFSALLLETGARPIVEHSRRDDFWGAKPVDEQTLIGINALGRLLMELRERVKNEPQESLLRVDPPSIPDFLLYSDQIGPICQFASGDTSEQLSAGERPSPVAGISVPAAAVAETVFSYSLTGTDCGLLNVNTATADDWQTLPGITPKLAAAIVAHREKYGPFLTSDKVKSVRGIGEKPIRKWSTR